MNATAEEKDGLLLGSDDWVAEEKMKSPTRWNVKTHKNASSKSGEKAIFKFFSMVIGFMVVVLLTGRLIRYIAGAGFPVRRLESQRWSEMPASSELVWHKCYDNYECARLAVPLDWTTENDERKATIAVIKYPATEAGFRGEDHKGSVFINPGGPGGSGVWFMRHLAPYYQFVVGKNYDIISFDPRGIGYTTPTASCWNGNSPSTSSLLWNLQEPPVLDAHSGVLYEAHAYASAYSQQCATQLSESGKYMSTASVARDMMHILEKLGEEKLKFWGFSYGTFLGVTFASMFPEKVGRIVNDGNVDAVDFAFGGGTHFLHDAEAVMSSFYTFCHRAGPVRCAFHASTPISIEKRLNDLLEKLKTHPVIVSSSSSNPRPEIITYSSVRKTVVSSLYRPLVMFPHLATILAALESGDGKPFLELTSQGSKEPPLCEQSSDGKHTEPDMPELEGSSDANKAIMCSDAPDLDQSVEAFGGYVKELQRISPSAGATMASMRLGCVGWDMKAKWRFGGPFGGNTSHPMLFIANTGDNVTPKRSTVANASLFPGSRILVQDTFGHTSLSTPSSCTANTIRDYFQTGELPEEGKACAGDCVPFMNCPTNGWSDGDGKADEKGDGSQIEMAEVLRRLMIAPVSGMPMKLNLGKLK